MSASGHIEVLIRFLRAAGVTVNEYAFHLPEWAAGRFHDDLNLIELNESNAREALKTLAHEAGHWLGYVLSPKRGDHRGQQRERQACVYGWRMLVLCGGDKLIGRAEWHAFNRGDLREPGSMRA